MKQITVKDHDLKKASEEGMDEFLAVFTNAYMDVIGGNITAETMDLLNGHQHSLLAYRIFCEEVCSGGFIQLIQNGYGQYIFENPFAKSMRIFGAERLSKLIYKAKKIYDENKEALERETTDEEFNAMYVEFEIFDPIEEEFFEIEEDQTSIIAHYVDKNIELFADIVFDN
jgi:nitrogenase subunit NifH